MKTYRIINETDYTKNFTVEAMNDHAALSEALQKLGWMLTEPQVKEDNKIEEVII